MPIAYGLIHVAYLRFDPVLFESTPSVPWLLPASVRIDEFELARVLAALQHEDEAQQRAPSPRGTV